MILGLISKGSLITLYHSFINVRWSVSGPWEHLCYWLQWLCPRSIWGALKIPVLYPCHSFLYQLTPWLSTILVRVPQKNNRMYVTRRVWSIIQCQKIGKYHKAGEEEGEGHGKRTSGQSLNSLLAVPLKDHGFLSLGFFSCDVVSVPNLSGMLLRAPVGFRRRR